MKLISLALIFANISFAHLNCKNFARVAPTQSDQANLADATICAKELSEALKSHVEALDKSTTDCAPVLDALGSAISAAQDFQSNASAVLMSVGPNERVKKRFQKGILDLTYALSGDLSAKACDENDYIEIKAQAQTEILALERTKYALP